MNDAADMKAQWYRIKVGVLPDNGVAIDAVMESKICRAIGEAVGPWTMIYGFECEVIPIKEREYPMRSKHGPSFSTSSPTEVGGA